MKDEYGTEVRNPQTNRFDKVTLPFYGDVTLGNMTMFRVSAFNTPNGRLSVGIEGHGSYTFTQW